MEIIEKFFKNLDKDKDKEKLNEELKENFKKKLNETFLVRVQVPENIDLNHYFEIMNTRGEQLEAHEIAKANILGVFEKEEDKRVGALIWEKCSNMDSYVQMNFDKSIREKLFADNWSSLNNKIEEFDDIKKVIEEVSNEKEDNSYDKSLKETKENVYINTYDRKTFLELLKESKSAKNSQDKKETEENMHFESIISFSDFLLQVNIVIEREKDEEAKKKKLRIEGSREIGCKSDEPKEDKTALDDKKLLEILKPMWCGKEVDEEAEEKAKNFLFMLLKCRVLFDKYILKREFEKNDGGVGKWSLKSLKKYEKYNNVGYRGTYGDEDEDEEEKRDEKRDKKKNRQIRALESCLRITYTSPQTMHWINILLTELVKDEECNVIKILEEYCNEKVKKSGYKDRKGFETERIVFTYLDYLLYRDGYPEAKIEKLQNSWEFQFRNSIEHFYPQNPMDGQENWGEDVHYFGNLALIDVSGNSKFSNMSPAGKGDTSIIEKSLKLKIMKFLMDDNNEKWTKDLMKIHDKKMFKILDEAVGEE